MVLGSHYWPKRLSGRDKAIRWPFEAACFGELNLLALVGSVSNEMEISEVRWPAQIGGALRLTKRRNEIVTNKAAKLI